MRSWSVSSVRQFHTCQLAWWFRRTGIETAFKPLALVEGTVLHAVLAFHLQGMRDRETPEVEEVLALLDALYFMEEASADIRYGRTDREAVLERLRALYRHWRATAEPAGTIVAVEEKIHVALPGLDLPLLGYADLVLRTSSGLRVIDFKVTASRPAQDDLLDALDLQKLAMTRGHEVQAREPVQGFGWTYLVKTRKPQIVERVLPVLSTRREADLLRLADIVNPTLAQMEAVLDGLAPAVPTPAYGRMCLSCPWRTRCGATSASPRPSAHASPWTALAAQGQKDI